MNDKWLRDRLVKSVNEDQVVEPVENEPAEPNTEKETPEATSNPVLDNATLVMASYQNANKWLDSLKEYLLMDLGCVHFSNYVHNLAHTMPERFDKFGDILHGANFKVPYPATEQFTKYPPDVNGAIQQVIDIITAINIALRGFIDVTKDKEYSVLALMTEELLVDINSEFVHLYRIQRVAASCEHLVMFDNWVAQYLNNLGSLID